MQHLVDRLSHAKPYIPFIPFALFVFDQVVFAPGRTNTRRPRVDPDVFEHQ